MCFKECGDCLVSVEKTLLCGHKTLAECYQEVENVVCEEPCPLRLGCGHMCAEPCSQPHTVNCSGMTHFMEVVSLDDRLEKERDHLLSWIDSSVSHTSSLMIGQFSGELQRFFQMIRFMQILQNLVNRGQDLSESGHTYSQKIAEIICGREEIKGGVLANLRELVNSLESCHPCGLGISEQERIEIVQAVGLSRGHWYKCPYGHVYVIGECGGAMEEAVCYECQNTGKGSSVRIGGSGHRLREGNQVAGEMDGARAAAWPDPRLDGFGF